ncbi:hypothetical protein F511_29587, partial [Dorcoceras hygrometricum]
EASGLRGFLGCESLVDEKELEQFFDTALVQDGDITGAFSGKYFSVSQSQFAEIFALPTEGLVTFSDVPKHLVYKARSIFSKSGEQVEIHGKKRFLKYEYRLLNDILAKAITVKASSFDAVTTERFQMMTAIQFGLKINWSKIVFNVLKEMVDRTQKKAKGYVVQIGVLLKSIPAITIGEGISFQASKILSMKTVNTYIATNQTIDAHGQTEEQVMASEAIEKRKSKSKKKSVSTDDTPVEVIAEIAGRKRPATEGDAPIIPKKRRTVKSKASPAKASLTIVSVGQDVVPLQIFEPTPAAAAVVSPAPKRRYPKRKLILSTGSDDETLDEQESVKESAEVTDRETTVAPTDEVDVIIEQVIAEASKLGTDETQKEEQSIDETDIGEDFDKWLDESFMDFVTRNSEQVIDETRTVTEAEGSKNLVFEKDITKDVGSKQSAEELMSIDDLLLQISDDMMLPSITVAKITKIRRGDVRPRAQIRDKTYKHMQKLLKSGALFTVAFLRQFPSFSVVVLLVQAPAAAAAATGCVEVWPSEVSTPRSAVQEKSGSQPISPSSSSSSHRLRRSLAVRGFDPEVSSSRRSRVLALLVQAVRVAVDLGLSFTAFAVESILPLRV